MTRSPEEADRSSCGPQRHLLPPATCDVFYRMEMFLEHTLGALGRALSALPSLFFFASIMLMIGFAAGLLWSPPEVETDVLKLWVAQDTRLQHELGFYEEHFSRPRAASILFTPQPGKSLLTVEAFDEIRAIHEWVQTVQYDGVTLQNLCYKVVGEPEEADTPCFAYSPMDCFQEGRVQVAGGTNNTRYFDIYSARQSYAAEDWTFSANLTQSYLEESCRQWYNLRVPSHMLFGGLTVDDAGFVADARAMRMVFALRTPETLVRDGLYSLQWSASDEGAGVDIFSCPLQDEPLDCDTCWKDFQITSAMAYGCIPNDVEQPESCCRDFMTPVVEHPCAGHVFASDATINTLGSMVARRCGLDPPRTPEPRCALLPDLRSVARSEDTDTDPKTAARRRGLLQVEAGDGCDAALRGSWGAACQEAAGDPTNATNVANCCELGAEFSACHCDAVLCDDACKGNLQEVAQTCGVMGMGFEPPACTADGCEPLRSAWGAACQEAAGDLTNLTAAVQCCALGAEFSTRACDCDAALCDGACMGNLQRASQSCEMLQMGFELPLCMAARVSGGDSARETTDGTCDAMCSALPNNPCAARCAAGECLYWYGGDECFTEKRYTQTTVQRTTPEMTEAEAQAIVEGWEQAFLDSIVNFTASFKHVRCTFMADRSVPDTLEEASHASWPLLAVGYALVLVYVGVYFSVERTPKGSLWPLRVATTPPTVFTALSAVLLIVLSTSAALGLCSGFLVLLGVHFNAISLQVIPFLSLGLGVNDFFVLAAATRRAVHARPRRNPAETLQAILSTAGVSVTLSSVANAAAFFLGALSPIPAVADFALQAGCTVTFNYVLAILIYPTMLFWDLQRHHRRLTGCSPPRDAVAEEALEEDDEGAKDYSLYIRTVFRNDDMRLRAVCKGFILAAYLVGLAVCAWGASKVELGLKLTDAVPSGTSLHDFAIQSEAYFHSAAITLTYDTATVDAGGQFGDILDLEYDFVRHGMHTDRKYNTTSFFRYFLDYTTAKYCGGTICDTSADGLPEVHWVHSQFDADRDQCEAFAVLEPEERRAACAAKCSFGQPKSFCPQHPTNSSQRCQLSEDSTRCTCAYLPVVVPGPEYEHHMQTMMSEGIRGRITRALAGVHHPDEPVSAIRTLSFVQDVGELEAKLEHVRRARALTDASPVDAFAFDYSTYALNEQYLHIRTTLLTVLAFALAAAAVVMLPLIVHPFTELLVLCIIVVTEVELFGLLYWFDMRLNAVVVANLVMSTGFAIEFTAHVSRAFMLASGSRDARAAAALHELAPPVLNGALTTLLGLAPILVSEYSYFRLYFLLQYVVIVLVCLVNGLILLPIVLSTVGPDSLVRRQTALLVPQDEPKTPLRT